jgi:dTDP-4-dehydrorhamnose reductase
MKILVPGADGQLGRQFTEVLGTNDYSVTALNRGKLDITDAEAVQNAISHYAPDVVINCAAYNFVDKAEPEFDTAKAVNAYGVRNLAISCSKSKTLLIHFSSDYVFDGKKGDFYTEEDEPNPINRYGESKLLGERFLSEETDNFLLFRLSWVFGEGRQNFLYKLSEWAKNRRILKIVYDQISIPTYTGDIVSITLFALRKGLRGIYHMTNGGYASRYEVARYFLERLGRDNLVLPVASDYFPSPATRPYFSAMSNSRISNELDVTIPEWKIGIDRYIRGMFEKEDT